MANTDSSIISLVSSADDALTSEENTTPINSRLTELNDSRAELLTRIQGMKQDLQNWRSKLDSQVKTHREELMEMKKTLNLEVEELRSEFEGLKSTLQQQHNDVVNSLKSLGMEDSDYPSHETKETGDPKVEEEEEEGGNDIDKEDATKETEH